MNQPPSVIADLVELLDPDLREDYEERAGIMEFDGNIRYANYQSQQEVIDYLTANGFGPETYAGDVLARLAPTGHSSVFEYVARKRAGL